MPPRLLLPSALLCGFSLLLSGCGKKADSPLVGSAAEKAAAAKPTIEIVAASEQSKNFAAVNKHLEIGGPLYGYVDIDGDVLKLTDSLQATFSQMAKVDPNFAAFANHDYSALATILGLTDIKALGVSSVPDGTGYFRNRMFFYTGGERRGLLAGFGGQAAPFKHLGLAPADTSFFGETEMDVAVVYRTIREVVTKVAGEPAGNQMEAALRQAGEAAALSVLDLIYGLKGRSAVVLRLDASKEMTFPTPAEPVKIPALSLLLCIEGIAPVIESSLAKLPMLRRSDEGAAHIYELTERSPVEGLQPILVVDGGTLYFASSRAFYDECRSQKSGLAQDAQFQRSLEQLGAEGNGLSYLSPRFFEQLRRVQTLNPGMNAEARSMFDMVLNKFTSADRPLVSIRTNLPEGILIRSHLNRSSKQEVAALTIYNPVTVGLLAAMAIPAFQKVRTASQEKAVLNNLRQLAAAADQFYLENGVISANYNDLVGPTRYIRQLVPVAGEDYRQLRFIQGRSLRVQLSDGRVIQYPLEEEAPVPFAIPPPPLRR